MVVEAELRQSGVEAEQGASKHGQVSTSKCSTVVDLRVGGSSNRLSKSKGYCMGGFECTAKVTSVVWISWSVRRRVDMAQRSGRGSSQGGRVSGLSEGGRLGCCQGVEQRTG
jgi:hypothetical protein